MPPRFLRSGPWLLFLIALGLRLWATSLDPFLNDWDEVYHAVVAKNMVHHPLAPMLYKETALPTTMSWAEQHFWLHKPPFFLWQMALAIKLFGAYPWTVRLPSALWTALMVPAVWRIGALLRNERTGFVAASLVTFSYLLQELVAGSINTDHNDAVFIALVTCSVWIWLEHVHKPTIWKAVAVGLFCAAAILTKWYVGALVFLPFGLTVLLQGFRRTDLKHFGLAMLAASIPVAAWIGHITRWFPAEAAFQWSFKSTHFSIPVDGHRGTNWFHLDAISQVVPPMTWWLLLPAVLWLVWRVKALPHRILLISCIGAVHVFFLLAQTKMVCYTMVLLPFYYLAMGNLVADVTERIRHDVVSNLTVLVATAGLCYLSLDPVRIRARHSLAESEAVDVRWRKQNLAVMADFPKLEAFMARSPKPIIFNLPLNHHLRFMFTHGIEAWRKPPGQEDVRRLAEKGYTVFVLQDGADPNSFPAGAVLVPDSVFAIPKDVRL